jgi:hypothetical protein
MSALYLDIKSLSSPFAGVILKKDLTGSGNGGEKWKSQKLKRV